MIHQHWWGKRWEKVKRLLFFFFLNFIILQLLRTLCRDGEEEGWINYGEKKKKKKKKKAKTQKNTIL